MVLPPANVYWVGNGMWWWRRRDVDVAAMTAVEEVAAAVVIVPGASNCGSRLLMDDNVVYKVICPYVQRWPP